MRIGKHETHPAADLFPMMGDEDRRRLAESMAEGVEGDCRIHTYRGLVLDGRNRLAVMLELGIDPLPYIVRVAEERDPLEVSWRLNGARRHLSPSQLAAVAARMANLGWGGDRSKPQPCGLPTADAAELTGASTRNTEKARAILKAEKEGGPELFEQIEKGELTVNAAHEEIKRRRNDPALSGGQTKRASGGTAMSHAEGYDSDEWYTPADYIEAARATLGVIDLDPASNDHAQRTVQAERYFTKDDDGLEQEWTGRVWLNPPYSQPLASRFGGKLVEEIEAGNVEAAVVVQNASTDTGWFHELASRCHLCLTRGRINFDRSDGASSQNRYGQVFFYYGDHPERFYEHFRAFGLVGKLE